MESAAELAGRVPIDPLDPSAPHSGSRTLLAAVMNASSSLQKELTHQRVPSSGGRGLMDAPASRSTKAPFPAVKYAKVTDVHLKSVPASELRPISVTLPQRYEVQRVYFGAFDLMR